MPIKELRVRNFRAFADSGVMKIGEMTPIVGKNDAGKSGLLHAISLFFDPPKKGVDVADLHGKDENAVATVEIAFDPSRLGTQEVQIDARNKIHLTNDRLVDSGGLLRLELSVSAKKVTRFRIFIQDVDDDSLFPLAIKNQNELLTLLKARKLPATKAGKETNQQKRNKLREHAKQAGKGLKEDWVDATAIEKELRAVLPELMLFNDTANYAIGETSVQNQFKGIVDKALADHSDAKKLEDEIRQTIQGEFDKVFERLQHLTNTVTSLKATTNVTWRKAVDGIDLSWEDSVGVTIPYELRGAGVRRLFMVAYFEYEAAASLHASDGPRYIFAVEEPEVHLHPGAQRDLDAAFRELADLGHTVIFTTHSPVFASTAPLKDLVLVVRESGCAEAQQLPDIDPTKVASELGVEASDRLVGKNHVILVEGPGDVRFYSEVLSILHDADMTGLAPDSVLFIQCGGIGNLRFSVTRQCITDAGLKWAVLVDSDRTAQNSPMGCTAQELMDNPQPSCSSVCVLERSNIENYLDPAVVKKVTGIDCRIEHYGTPTDLSGNKLGKRALRRLKEAGPMIVKKMGLAGILEHSKDASGSSEFVMLFEQIKNHFGL